MYNEIKRREARIEKIKEEISCLGEVRPGAISRQYNVCGTPNCRCKDPENPKKHGPYYQLNYTRRGKSNTEFVKEKDLSLLQTKLRDYKTLKSLVDEWIEVSLELSRLRRQKTKTPNR